MIATIEIFCTILEISNCYLYFKINYVNTESITSFSPGNLTWDSKWLNSETIELLTKQGKKN